MGNWFKFIAGRSLYLIVGIVLLLASFLVFKVTFSSSSRSYSARRTEKSFLIAGAFLAIGGLGTILLAFDKKKEWNNEKEVIKLTGKKVNNNPEVKVEIEKFKIEPLFENSAYTSKCIKSNIVFKGEEKELTIYLADEGEYEKIANAKKIFVAGEFKDEFSILSIDNARIVYGSLTIV